MPHFGRKLDWLIMLLLALALAGGVVLFGGVRNWAAGVPLVLCFAGLTLFALQPGRDRWLFAPGSLFLVLFLVYQGAMGLHSPAYSTPIWYLSKQESLYAWSYAGACWAWTRLAASGNRWRTALVLWVFGVSLIAGYALGLQAQGLPRVLLLERPEQYGMRASGTHMCPNHFAHLLAMAMITAVTLLALPRAGLPARLVSGYALLVMLPAFILTQSRSGLLGLAAGLSVTGLLLAARHSRRRLLLTATVLPVIAAVLFAGLAWISPVFRVRWLRVVEGDIRLRLWPDVWELIRASPVLGHGPGTFAFVFQRYRNLFDDAGHSLHYAHNEYLHAWADYGLVGLLLLLAAAVMMVTTLIRLYRHAPSSIGTCLIAGLLGILTASFVQALFDFNFHLFGNMQALAFLVGTGWAALYRHRVWRPREKAEPVKGSRLVAGMLTGLGLAAALQFAAGAILQARGTLLLQQSDAEQARACYRTVIRIDPGWWLPYQSLGHIHQAAAFWRRDEAVRETERNQAEQYYRKALQRNPHDAVSHHGLARLFRQSGRKEEALAHIRHAMRLNIFNLMYKTEYGLLLNDLGRREEARAVFTAILAADPHHAVARANLLQ